MSVGDLIEILRAMPAHALVVNAFEGGLAMAQLEPPRLGRGVLFPDGTIDERPGDDGLEVVYFE